SDPDCPFCRKLEHELDTVPNLTVHLFLLPLKIHPNAAERSRQIWCAENSARAWTEYVLRDAMPPSGQCSNDPVAEVAELASRLNIGGTPTLYFSDGERRSGVMTGAEFESRFSQISLKSVGSCALEKEEECSR